MRGIVAGGSIRYNLDDEARAELLTYLVAVQLVARVLTGDWLNSWHLCESALLWLHSNGANCSGRERAELSMLSGIVAVEILKMPTGSNETWLGTLSMGSWRLDYRQPATRMLHDMCVDHLGKHNKPAEI
jgi:hypothetical protein